jgi:hypothetical protein
MVTWAAMLILLALAGGVFLSLFLVLALARGGRNRAAIPRSELASLGTAIRDADQLAAQGDAPEGYRCLVAGLQRAEQAVHTGRPWARELRDRWQEVAQEYSREYPIAPPTEIAPAPTPEGRGDELAPGSG